MGVFFGCGEWGLLLLAMFELLTAVTSLLWRTCSRRNGSGVAVQGPWRSHTVVVAHGLNCSTRVESSWTKD